MRIHHLDLDDNGMPARIGAELTLAEAVYVARLTGGHSQLTADKVMPGGGHLNGRVYATLSCDVLNRYFDDGMADAQEYIASHE